MGEQAAVSKQVYIAWIDFQRRAESMNQYVDFDLYYLPPPTSRKWLKPLGYLLQAWRTVRIVLAEKPDTVWVQSPPGMVPHILLALRGVTRRYGLIIDCHNASMLPPWSHFPGVAWVLNRSDRVLVHNEEMRSVVEAHGVTPELIRVLEDPPPGSTCRTCRRWRPMPGPSCWCPARSMPTSIYRSRR